MRIQLHNNKEWIFHGCWLSFWKLLILFSLFLWQIRTYLILDAAWFPRENLLESWEYLSHHICLLIWGSFSRLNLLLLKKVYYILTNSKWSDCLEEYYNFNGNIRQIFTKVFPHSLIEQPVLLSVQIYKILLLNGMFNNIAFSCQVTHNNLFRSDIGFIPN